MGTITTYEESGTWTGRLPAPPQRLQLRVQPVPQPMARAGADKPDDPGRPGAPGPERQAVSGRPGGTRALQMRLIVRAEDYEDAVTFYRDILGAGEELQIHSPDGENVTILDVGRATLEISNPVTGRPHRPCRGRPTCQPASASRVRSDRRRHDDHNTARCRR